MDYKANPDALRKAGASAKSAGEQAGQVKLGPPAEDIAEAMPGGKSEGASKQVVQSWEKAIKTWSQAAAQHGESLNASADEYQQSDESSAADIDRAGAQPGK
ncbi:hypothetical protein AB0I53_27390 [Saccharopolyspora sp. NPDC050389]|uniref:hypothetical protein n=1 Tax=Saccharopolyspora sp. NPDC050389 TaxID=3155516 RepID=UPI0033F11953